MAGKTRVKDMTGLKFGCLTVVCREGTYRNTTQAQWLCQCACGTQSIVCGSSLRRGFTKSCGCQRGGSPIRHGRSKDSIYSTWTQMLGRCRNPSNHSYQRYGGRGIRVCRRWHVFENFLEDMGERPAGLTINRIDNSGNYEPSNCRWATWKEQANNTRRNRVIQTSRGPLSIAQVAKIAGITYIGVQKRLQQGEEGDFLLRPKRQGRWSSTTC